MVIFKPGDIISHSLPFVHVLNYDQKGVLCDFCFDHINSRSDQITCQGCEMMHYCQDSCAQNDLQNFHGGSECDYYQQIRQKLRSACYLNTPRLILRLYFMVRRDGRIAEHSQTLFDGRTRCLNQLMSHGDQIGQDEKRMKLFNSIKQTLNYLHISFDEHLLFELFGKTFINAFTIFDRQHDGSGSLVDIGRGLYLEASVFDHSCRPNANYSFDGIALEVRANRSINTDHEPVLINYLNANVSRKERRVYLQRQYYFTCRCDLCAEEERCESSKDNRLNRENIIRRIICSIFYY